MAPGMLAAIIQSSDAAHQQDAGRDRHQLNPSAENCSATAAEIVGNRYRSSRRRAILADGGDPRPHPSRRAWSSTMRPNGGERMDASSRSRSPYSIHDRAEPAGSSVQIARDISADDRNATGGEDGADRELAHALDLRRPWSDLRWRDLFWGRSFSRSMAGRPKRPSVASPMNCWRRSFRSCPIRPS